jgi:hypothetical protein
MISDRAGDRRRKPTADRPSPQPKLHRDRGLLLVFKAGLEGAAAGEPARLCVLKSRFNARLPIVSETPNKCLGCVNYARTLCLSSPYHNILYFKRNCGAVLGNRAICVFPSCLWG